MNLEKALLINNINPMCAQIKHDKTPNLILSLIQCKCPRCRRGDMFERKNPYTKGFMKMNDTCPVCSQPMDLEPGFYYGTIMISYALSVMLCLFTFILYWLTIGFGLHDNRFFWWMGLNAFLLIIMQPPLMRVSRSFWLGYFVRYSPKWDEGDIVERYNVNKEQAANW